MNLNKELNLNKKFIIIMILLSIISIGLYYSYALFQITGKQIHLTTTISGDTNPFTLSANQVSITLGAEGGLTEYPIDLETGRNEIEVLPPPGNELVLAASDAKESAISTCQNKTRTTEDNITYISGTANCIDFNYVWYSGKLWRIKAIYNDGTEAYPYEVGL